MKFINVCVLALILAVTGCSTTQNQVLYGSALASLGGLLGAQFGGGSAQAVSGSAGALAGAALGATLGKTVDDVEKLKENSKNLN
jgi:uncharacterized protein YcfJ